MGMKYLGHNLKELPRGNGKYPTMGMMSFIPYQCTICGLKVTEYQREIICDPCKGKKRKGTRV